MAFSSAEPMQAGVPPCSSHKSTQWKSEVERSGGTRKQVVPAGEGVQPVGQAVAAAGRIVVTITRKKESRCGRVARLLQYCCN